MKLGTSRSLPRVFLPGATPDVPFELPQAELDKLRKVLRLGTGAGIAVLPNDGTLLRCRLDGRRAVPESVETPNTEARMRLILAQALPKGDRLETVVRMGTEIGVAGFALFPADRSVVRWEPEKLAKRLQRLEAIAREAAEQSFRTLLPQIRSLSGLDAVLDAYPGSIVLSEGEDVRVSLSEAVRARMAELSDSGGGRSREPKEEASALTLVVGPEGGWSPRELTLIGERAVTLGPRVLRTDTAGPAAAAVVLLGIEPQA